MSLQLSDDLNVAENTIIIIWLHYYYNMESVGRAVDSGFVSCLTAKFWVLSQSNQIEKEQR